MLVYQSVLYQDPPGSTSLAAPQERVDAKNAFDGYIHSMRSATEGSGDNKGLSEKMDSDEACAAVIPSGSYWKSPFLMGKIHYKYVPSGNLLH